MLYEVYKCLVLRFSTHGRVINITYSVLDNKFSSLYVLAIIISFSYTFYEVHGSNCGNTFNTLTLPNNKTVTVDYTSDGTVGSRPTHVSNPHPYLIYAHPGIPYLK